MTQERVKSRKSASSSRVAPSAPSGSGETARGGAAGVSGAQAPGAPAEVPEPTPEQIQQAGLLSASLQHPFGPGFFYAQLRGYALDHCPNPLAGLPVVGIHLADGDVLDLCHIIGVTPQWVALAVRESEHGAPERMRTEFVPYATIVRVTLRSSRLEAPQLGFEHARVPRVMGGPGQADMSPEAAVRAAAAMVERRGR